MELSLRPYPGVVIVCKSRKAYQKAHKKVFGEHDAADLSVRHGRMAARWVDGEDRPVYVVWGESTPHLAHELSHVILHVFELAGIDPREANGEPFCYLLSQLLLDAQS